MSSSSDLDLDPEEFWDDLEEIIQSSPESPSKISVDFRRNNTILSNSPNKFLFKQLSTLPEEFFKQRMEQSIQKLRLENHEKVKSVKVAVRNHTRKELKSAVDEIRAQFEREIRTIRQDHDKMKEEISRKNQEILLIAEYMIDQEAMITQNRVNSTVRVKEFSKSDEVIADEKQLKKDLGVLKVQIDAMKEAIKEYSNETIQSAAKVKELDNEIEMIQSKHREELKTLETYLENRVSKAIEAKEKVFVEFEDFKKIGWGELEEKEESCKKQKIVIIALQNELKKAKGILQNPRLKLRVHEKLKDYLDEYELESNESVSVMANKSGISHRRSRTIEKRNIYTTRSNFDNSVKFGSLLQPPVDESTYQIKRNLGYNRSRFSEG